MISNSLIWSDTLGQTKVYVIIRAGLPRAKRSFVLQDSCEMRDISQHKGQDYHPYTHQPWSWSWGCHWVTSMTWPAWTPWAVWRTWAWRGPRCPRPAVPPGRAPLWRSRRCSSHPKVQDSKIWLWIQPSWSQTGRSDCQRYKVVESSSRPVKWHYRLSSLLWRKCQIRGLFIRSIYC